MITVSIVDDSTDLRQSIANFINRSAGFQCVSMYGSGEAALKGLSANQPDVVLMDINMTGMTGIECVERLKAVAPGVQIVMLTIYEDTEKIFNALSAGASGYLLKRLSPSKLLQAIREVHAGGSPMSGSIARKVVASFQTTESSGPRLPELSPREQEVLELLAQGCSNKEIADKLSISIETVTWHLRHIYTKLHVRSRTQATLRFLSFQKEP
jgi:DNA-binding NarL/FixJ family response regulator